MPDIRCRYDCYQINLQVNLSEEDSCLFSRYGQSLFNIKNCSLEDDCRSCILLSDDCDAISSAIPARTSVPVKIPDAVILGIDIDRCDCTKATFSLHVRLPSKSFKEAALKCAVQDVSMGCEACTICEDTALAELKSNVISYMNTPMQLIALCESSVDEIDGTIPKLLAAIIALETYIGEQELNLACKILLDALGALTDEVTSLRDFLNNPKTSGVYEAQKFCITSGASGRECEIITFNVAPLSANTVSTGVFDKCYTYEATRVPCRVPCRKDLDDCTLSTGISYDPEPYCGICTTVEPFLVPDTVRIMFPMTKQIKCLVPDFGLTGSYLNAALGTVDTLVRLVSCSPCKFCLPAKLSFDKENCMVCLDISTEYIMTNYLQEFAGYEHRLSCCEEFGSGCKSKCKCEVADLKSILTEINATFDAMDDCAETHRARWMTLGNTVFQHLARSKKIDVRGVNKCAESVLFSFQVCYFPYRGFCVDICGCKPVKTVPEDDSTDNVPNVLGAESSFRVQTDCGEYSYEFLKVSGLHHHPQTTCLHNHPTTTCND